MKPQEKEQAWLLELARKFFPHLLPVYGVLSIVAAIEAFKKHET